MDTKQSIVLRQTYFNSPEYLVVQCYVDSTFCLVWHKNSTGPHVYHYTLFFSRIQWGTTPFEFHVLS